MDQNDIQNKDLDKIIKRKEYMKQYREQNKEKIKNYSIFIFIFLVISFYFIFVIFNGNNFFILINILFNYTSNVVIHKRHAIE